MNQVRRVQVIDSHTEGEPTRVVVGGGPDLVGRSLAEMAKDFRSRHDAFRSGVVCEPRGSDAVVGALLLPASKPEAAAGVIFFNNGSTLGMCVHGTIGVVATLAHLGRASAGDLLLETPVGDVTATLHEDGAVTVTNVESFRYKEGVEVQVDGFGAFKGDIAYGGNWFFLVEAPDVEVSPGNLDELERFATAVRHALERMGITGEDGAEIDHIEVFAPPVRTDAHSKNFVLCPGLAYDRSPCGTGTSAKLACLAAAGKLAPGEIWRQESVIGSLFKGTYSTSERGIVPRISGAAYITAEADLLFHPDDPFRNGIPL
jgi:4-hydroxyproline epimerase